MKRRNRQQGKQENINYQSGDWLSHTEAVALLAGRDKRPHDAPKAAKDRWRNRINNHTKKGNLPSENEQYRIEDLAAWARGLNVSGKEQTAWLQQLEDLPNTGRLCGVLPPLIGILSGFSEYPLPTSLEASHEAISRLNEENQALRKQVELLSEEVSQLRPNAEKYKNICEKNRRSAQRKPQSTEA